jgi:hypothetical protein
MNTAHMKLTEEERTKARPPKTRCQGQNGTCHDRAAFIVEIAYRMGLTPGTP